MTRILSILMSCAIAAASVSPWCAARQPLPRCCKAHGCTMKRATRQCVLAACDRQADSEHSAKQPLGVVPDDFTSMQRTAPYSLSADVFRATPSPPSPAIDHPPRLLFV